MSVPFEIPGWLVVVHLPGLCAQAPGWLFRDLAAGAGLGVFALGVSLLTWLYRK